MSDERCDRCRVRPVGDSGLADAPCVLCAPCALELNELKNPWMKWGLKRLAWAYGCAPHGSEREAVLLAELQKRFTAPT